MGHTAPHAHIRAGPARPPAHPRASGRCAGSVAAYYESYWSAGGHCPVGGLSPDTRRVLGRHIGASARCLDVGCGDGRTAGTWLRAHAAAYTGVDISANAVAMARALGLDALHVDDAEQLPFADASFDAAVCLEVLEHLWQPQAVAVEIARVLAPGGVLIATVPNVAHWKARVDLALRGRWDPRGDGLSVSQPWRDPHLRFFTAGSLASMLRRSGFAQVTVGGRQASLARNFRALERYGRPEPGPVGRWLAERVPALGAGLCAVAVRDR